MTLSLSFYCQTQPCVEVRLGFWQLNKCWGETFLGSKYNLGSKYFWFWLASPCLIWDRPDTSPCLFWSVLLLPSTDNWISFHWCGFHLICQQTSQHCLIFWYCLVLSIKVLYSLVLTGTVWYYLVISDTVCYCLTLSGTLWYSIIIWYCLIPSDTVW